MFPRSLKPRYTTAKTMTRRKEQPGWDAAAFSDPLGSRSRWFQTVGADDCTAVLSPVRAEQALSAKAVTSPQPGIYIYDFGQNLAGVARLRVQGPAGTDVQLRFAEVLNPDGTLYIDNLRTAKATDHFILSGKGAGEFQPDFTFHGFAMWR